MWAVGAPWWWRLLTVSGFAGLLWSTTYLWLTAWVIRARRDREWVTIDE